MSAQDGSLAGHSSVEQILEVSKANAIHIGTFRLIVGNEKLRSAMSSEAWLLPARAFQPPPGTSKEATVLGGIDELVSWVMSWH
jgi:hypothetical protein